MIIWLSRNRIDWGIFIRPKYSRYII